MVPRPARDQRQRRHARKARAGRDHHAPVFSCFMAGGGINALHLLRGRMPTPGSQQEVVASQSFAWSNQLEPGDAVRAVINGRYQTLRIAGIAVSPEYIYALGPGQIVPDNRRYGVLWMARAPLAAALLLLTASPQADEGMWTFDNLPLAKMKAKYGFAPDQAWLDHVLCILMP